jgi:voltage-gated potassium channel Kch
VINPELNSIFILFPSLSIISGVFAMSRERTFISIALLVGIPAILAKWITYAFYTDTGDIFGYVFSIIFFGIFAFFLLVQLLKSDRITGDTIAGAISIYLLIGITFAFTYLLIEQLQPGSLYFNIEIKPNGLNLMDYVYFSFVTMTTMGYGDITPVSPTLQSVAYFEALIGSIYIVVFIARLVSSYGKER